MKRWSQVVRDRNKRVVIESRDYGEEILEEICWGLCRRLVHDLCAEDLHNLQRKRDGVR